MENIFFFLKINQLELYLLIIDGIDFLAARANFHLWGLQFKNIQVAECKEL